MSIRYQTYREYKRRTHRIARRKHEQLTNLANLLRQRDKIIESAFMVMESQAELIEFYVSADKAMSMGDEDAKR